MPTITIYEDEQITVLYHPEKKIIHHQMHEHTHGSSFRTALMAGADAMKKYQVKKWLSDDRKNPVLRPEDQQWGIDVWQPKIIEAGWKYWAIIQPEYTLAKMRMEKLAEMYAKLGVTVQMFSDPDEAMSWLENQ